MVVLTKVGRNFERTLRAVKNGLVDGEGCNIYRAYCNLIPTKIDYMLTSVNFNLQISIDSDLIDMYVHILVHRLIYVLDHCLACK